MKVNVQKEKYLSETGQTADKNSPEKLAQPSLAVTEVQEDPKVCLPEDDAANQTSLGASPHKISKNIEGTHLSVEVVSVTTDQTAAKLRGSQNLKEGEPIRVSQ